MNTSVAAAPVLARRTSMTALFSGAAAMSTAMVGASTAATLVASEANGDAWSGVPNAAGVLGTALGAFGGGALLHARGTRTGLLILYGAATVGALIAVAGAVTASLLPLLVGMLLLGLGAGAAQLSRYAAADLYPQGRKAFGLSIIVAAGTVGAIAGPAMLVPAANAARWLRLPELAGPVVAAAVLVAAAAGATATLRRVRVGPPGRRPGPAETLATLRSRVVLLPLTAMVSAHVAMVAVMTMAPLHLHRHGHGLTEVGWVLSAHMVGMFALAPLSGRIADRWGARPTIALGIGVLVVSAATVIAAPGSHDTGLPLGLFLLGYGWNLVFVGGSHVLSGAIEDRQRSQVQGAVDACVWGASAVASIAAGSLFAVGGFVLVTAVAAAFVLVPLMFLSGYNERGTLVPGASGEDSGHIE